MHLVVGRVRIAQGIGLGPGDDQLILRIRQAEQVAILKQEVHRLDPGLPRGHLDADDVAVGRADERSQPGSA